MKKYLITALALGFTSISIVFSRMKRLLQLVLDGENHLPHNAL